MMFSRNLRPHRSRPSDRSCEDAQQLAGARYSRGGGRVGYRWGRIKGKIGSHGGKLAVHRARVRSYDGHEVALPTWTAAEAENWLGRWAMNLMLINVSTRKLRRAVRLPEGDLPVIAGDATSKSAASRRFRGTVGRTPSRHFAFVLLALIERSLSKRLRVSRRSPNSAIGPCVARWLLARRAAPYRLPVLEPGGRAPPRYPSLVSRQCGEEWAAPKKPGAHPL
jgi:hypothetical protein